MSPNKIIRAWKDEDYRLSLTSEERGLLPENPAGIIELSEDELGSANGGTDEGTGIVLPTTIPISLGVTAALSCFPACNATVWKGTCAVASVGCCPAGDAAAVALF